MTSAASTPGIKGKGGPGYTPTEADLHHIHPDGPLSQPDLARPRISNLDLAPFQNLRPPKFLIACLGHYSGNAGRSGNRVTGVGVADTKVSQGLLAGHFHTTLDARGK